MSALFVVLSVLVMVGTALALAGRWQPEGIGPEPPAPPPQGRFRVVLRGYDMAQVDAELDRLHDLLAKAGVPESGNRPTFGS